MTDTSEPDQSSKVDPIDREAATIDARSEDAPERIAELVEDAKALDRDVEGSPTPPTDTDATEKRGDHTTGADDVDGD